jgi:hypothetical protein
MFIRKVIILTCLFSLSGCLLDIANSPSFDHVCSAFETLAKHNDLSSLSAEDRYSFIENEIRNLDIKSNARAAFNSIENAVIQDRYYLFKGVVDSIEDGDWSCEAMEVLVPTIEKAYSAASAEANN